MCDTERQRTTPPLVARVNRDEENRMRTSPHDNKTMHDPSDTRHLTGFLKTQLASEVLRDWRWPREKGSNVKQRRSLQLVAHAYHVLRYDGQDSQSC